MSPPSQLYRVRMDHVSTVAMISESVQSVCQLQRNRSFLKLVVLAFHKSHRDMVSIQQPTMLCPVSTRTVTPANQTSGFVSFAISYLDSISLIRLLVNLTTPQP